LLPSNQCGTPSLTFQIKNRKNGNRKGKEKEKGGTKSKEKEQKEKGKV
jgi:hypothetical protein